MADRPDTHARFETLVRQYSRLISGVVRRVAGRTGDLVTGDIEQKVHVALWRQVETEQTIDHPTSYIYRIAVREAVRVLRQEAARETRPISAAEKEVPADQDHSPYEVVARREQREVIEASLGELIPDRERAVRAHLAGFGIQEIIEMYGWSYQKARNLLARGMADLREALQRRGIHG